MKNSLIFFIIAVLMFLIAGCASVGSGGTESDADEMTESCFSEEAPETEPETEAETEPETEAETEPDHTYDEPKTIEVTWHRGYVASDTNVTSTSTVMDGAKYYSYTDVFTIPRAGTRITFTDGPENDGSADPNHAAESVYVFSFWKKNSGEKWTLDTSSPQYSGLGFCDTYFSKITGDGELTYFYVTSKDNENIRLCYRSGETAGDKIDYPEVTAHYTGESSTYEKSVEYYSDLTEWVESTKSSAWYPVLENKTLNIIGDSYFAGNHMDNKYVWPALLARKYGMTFVNHGANSSTVCVTEDNNRPMVNRYNKLPDNDPDIVIVEGGRNDFSQFKKGKGGDLGEIGKVNDNTFIGALTKIVRGLKQKYPDALIICVTPWAAGDGVEKYAFAMKEVCTSEGIPCFDATNQKVTKVRMTVASFRAKYCMGPDDKSHLNLEGMKLVMPVFEEFIAEEYSGFLERRSAS